jgi:DNA-binding NtrC family response regulator
MSSEQDTLCTLTDLGDHSVLLPSVRVTVTLPLGETIEAPLGMDPLLVGTSPECDIVVADARISRRHCELRLTRRGIILRDLGSKNGTFIGEVPIFEVILPPQVSATLGNSRLTVKMGGAPSLIALSPSNRFGDAIGKSVSMRALFAKLKLAAETNETILLFGESGTGKEILAKAIHAHSPRKDGPFVVFDCSSVAPSLIETELFGHAKGAFTSAGNARAGLLEQANGGTLFIDELGELPLELQPKLLRALEARQVRRVGANDWLDFDARVVVATHRNLRTQIAAGAFRQDLYYRLAVVEVHVPALRERKDDIPFLAEAFLAAREPPRTLSDLPTHALGLLAAHDWPGNVRELRNTVARLVLFPELGQEVFGMEVAANAKGSVPPAKLEAPELTSKGFAALLELPLLAAREAVVEQFDRSYLAVKLREHGGNISQTADAIHVSRQLVHRLIERYGLRGDRP